jgi:uncharacterized protein (TIGR03083 family)
MDDNQVWQAIDEERLRLAEVLGQLTEKEWRHRSLCEGWMGRDVVAHLTSQELGLFAAIGILIRGPTTRHEPDDQRRRPSGRHDVDRSDDRGNPGHGWLAQDNIGLTCRETLIDILLHGQDIAIPLHRPALPRQGNSPDSGSLQPTRHAPSAKAKKSRARWRPSCSC